MIANREDPTTGNEVVVVIEAGEVAEMIEEEEEEERPRFNLTILKAGSGSGTVTTNPAGAAFVNGTQVTLTAVSDTASEFTGWRRACANADSNVCVFSIQRHDSVTANFVSRHGVRRLDGEYKGMWSGLQSAGNNVEGPITLITVVNGVVSGDLAPISGSSRTLNATMSEEGTFTAQLASTPAACGVTFTATGASTTVTNGIARATISGTYSLNPTSTCNPGTGTWSATRY